MKKNSQIGMIALVIIVGVIVGVILDGDRHTGFETSHERISTNDPYKELRSDGKHVDEENQIKETVDMYMFENFGSIYKTTWFDSISASGAVINEYGRFFVIQSNGDNNKAKEFVGGLLSFFNDKTISENYRVSKVILINIEKEIIYEVETINW